MSDAGIFFADLRLLWVLAPLFLGWLALWLALPAMRAALGRKQRAALRFSTFRAVGRLPRSRAQIARRAARGLRWLSVGLLLTAMLRPQTGRTLTHVGTEGIDIVLVLDTSGSMQALDLDAQERVIARRRNRLQVAVDVVERFVEARPSDQIGLVVFGTHAFTQCPLTLDHGIVATFLERVEIGMAGEETAIGDALGIALKRLQDSQARSKVVILLTDGRSNAGAVSPVTAAEIAQTLGIKVYTIGAGARGQAPFLVDTRLGPQVIYENVEIDEDTLRRIAELTGGAYFRAEDEAALASIYQQIDQLEKSELTMESFTEYEERFAWLVAPSLVLLLLEVGLLGTRLRVLP
ncbi:MAG TPA: VWA domain-containing protein [Thermoanaerobaculia bacterium]|nr:VWA domain-containing protein [Thermoanaerobaculia bacterium]